MSQTILIEQNDEQRKIISVMLETFVETDIIHITNADDAIELLKILPELPLIITNFDIGGVAIVPRLHDHIKRNHLPTEIIVTTGEPDGRYSVTWMNQPLNWEHLVKTTSLLLKTPLHSMLGGSPIFIPLRIGYFHEISRTPCDVFIQIKNSPTEFQYVKLIHAGSDVDHQTIAKYEAQNLQSLYITKDNVSYFNNYITNQIVQRLERQDLSMEERIRTTATAHEIVREAVQRLEPQGPWVELSNASIFSMKDSITNSSDTHEVLKLVLVDDISYGYKHCHLVSLLCHYILLKQSWYKAHHLDALTFVSYFSHITLSSSEQMKISTKEELDRSPLSDVERLKVERRSLDAVEALDDHPDFSAYIKTILLQSSGSSDGTELVENPPESIHPLAKVFIVADAFVKILLDEHTPSTKKEILPLLAARYTGASYQRIIYALEQKY